MKVRIGTRGSKLALWQANFVKKKIEESLGWEVELVIIKTKGDKITDVPLAKVGGKGLFVKEIEEALLREEVDLAVHSLKDMPAELPEGLEIIAYTERETPWDAIVSREPIKELSDLSGKVVGTSSLRRTAQIKHYVMDAEIRPLRGNLDTRLRKLAEGQYDAIVVALAGLKRLGLKPENIYVAKDLIPAIGQGILAVEAREGSFREVAEVLDDPTSRIEATAERAFLKVIGGTCQIPVGAHAQVDGNQLDMRAFIGRPDGEYLYVGKIGGDPNDAADLGRRLAEELLEIGGKKILNQILGGEA